MAINATRIFSNLSFPTCLSKDNFSSFATHSADYFKSSSYPTSTTTVIGGGLMAAGIYFIGRYMRSLSTRIPASLLKEDTKASVKNKIQIPVESPKTKKTPRPPSYFVVRKPPALYHGAVSRSRKVIRLANLPPTLKSHMEDYIASTIGKKVSLTPSIIAEVKQYLESYPEKHKVNFSNLNTEAGQLFVLKAFETLTKQCEAAYERSMAMGKETTTTIPKQEKAIVYRVYDNLSAQTNPVIRLRDIHQHELALLKAVKNAKTYEEMQEIAEGIGKDNQHLWSAKWTGTAERLARTQGHKAIYELWPISMQELSDLHRDIEALSHLLDQVKYSDWPIIKRWDAIKKTDPNRYTIPAYEASFKQNREHLFNALKIHIKNLNFSTLEKMTKSPVKKERPDIPDTYQAYMQKWRGLRTAPGSRDNHVLKALNRHNRVYFQDDITGGR